MRVGYKTLDDEWNGDMGFHYELGAEYAESVSPKAGTAGFHYCDTLWKLAQYRHLEEGQQVIVELEILGDVDTDGLLSASDRVRVLREVPWDEALRALNRGTGNAGLRNIGNDNRGDGNVGDGNIGDANVGNRNAGGGNHGSRNIGYHNRGNENVGDSNVGGGNIGACNSGMFNIGAQNAGEHNFGNYCCGKFNMGDSLHGAFNTEPQPVMVFNRSTTLKSVDQIHFPAFMGQVKYERPRSVGSTPDVRNREVSEKERRRLWREAWDRAFDSGMSDDRWGNLKTLLELPNFRFGLFEEITGITRARICGEAKKLKGQHRQYVEYLIEKVSS